MKIGFEETPAAPAGTYSRHLAKLLAEYAPEHEYIVDGARYKELDLYHGFRPGLPLPLLRRIPSVMTVDNLNFLRYPHLYSLPERLVLLRLYRRMLRSASRVITVNRDAREELSDRLRIDPGRIEVVMPLAARMPQNPPDGAELEGVRRKYALPRDFVLMLGTVEPRHNQEVLFEALALLREREREMLETRGAEMPTAAERTEVRAAERTGAQAGPVPYHLCACQSGYQLRRRRLEAFQRSLSGGLVEAFMLQGTTDQDVPIAPGNRITPLGQDHARQEIRGTLVQDHLAFDRFHRQ